MPCSRFLVALAAALVLVPAAAAGAQSTAPTPVPWGGIDLDERLLQYRDDHRIAIGRNVAVYEFQYPDGRKGTIAIDSERHSKHAGDRILGHSERRASEILRSYGIPDSAVTRIHSELQPCSLPGAYCAKMISERFPQAKVTYTWEYGDTRDSRQRGNAAKRQVLGDYYGRRDAAQQALRVPGAKPPTGPLTNALVRPFGAPGGVDLSTLELRYVSDRGPRGGGISYALKGRPGGGPADPAAGLAAAKRSSDAFFAWLTLPTSSFWVNLMPNQPDRIIDPAFARTDAGHVLLDADLRLKRLVGPLTNPANATGAEFWRRIDALYGNDRLEANACYSFRQWITPAPATVRETRGELYILDAPLTVQMEAAELGPGTIGDGCPAESAGLLAAKGEVFRQVILPRIQAQVNTAPEFAELRRVYLSRVAAEWVRTRADRRTPLGRLVDSGAVDRWVAQPAWNPLDIFNAYLASVRNGEYSYQRTFKQNGQTYTLTYITGGVDMSRTPRQNVSQADFTTRWPGVAARARAATRGAATDAATGETWLGAGRNGAAQARLRDGARRRPASPLRLRMRATARRGQVRVALRLANRGRSRVRGIQVCAALPAGLALVRASRPHAVRGGQACWDVRQLRARRATAIRFRAAVAPGTHGRLRTRATASVAGAPLAGALATRSVRVR